METTHVILNGQLPKLTDITEGTLPLEQGGTGATSADAARENLDVYSKPEMDTSIKKATSIPYLCTLTAIGWTQSGSEYTQTYTQPALTCGSAGTTPPLISFTSNQDEYNYIESADAEPGVGITFHSKIRPSNDIGLVIIDIG